MILIIKFINTSYYNIKYKLIIEKNNFCIFIFTKQKIIKIIDFNFINL